ncbi:hypothetical protein EUGRSUZ_C02762 [Eucalyptus grandis]|uniref:Uncharacterized protein n=2 Tax=Eucalyptus grandis TaxID=71139 RepID=A0A059CT43_EUCGR|nr:hypothetical protein EUGRSUZ_C02762 [Eucalyptus grandis]
MSHHTTIEIVEQRDAAVGTDTDWTTVEDKVDRCFDQLERLLQEVPRGFPAEPETSPCTIFRIPQLLRGINSKAEEPEIVSIGPYHRGRPQVLEFERLKPLFLKRFVRRCKNTDLRGLTKLVVSLEPIARPCYSGRVDLTSHDFSQTMLLDGCFVLEFLLHPLFGSGDLENQIPYIVLRDLFDKLISASSKGLTGSLTVLALKLFNHAYPRPMADLKARGDLSYVHLLDLFYQSLSPTRPMPNIAIKDLMKPVVQMTNIAIKDFMTSSLMKPVIQMPNIAINDFMTTVLINCVSLDQCRANGAKYMSDYVSFMHCLINQPKDVSLLRSDGIIALYSRDDQYVADLFNKLGKGISFSVHDCFLSKQFEELESYYSSNWAKMMRTYFSSPWSVISLFSAFLIVVLTITQTVIAILAYRFHR